MNGLNMCVTALSDLPGLKAQVDTLGFGHLVLDVRVPKVVFFRDAIFNLSQVELGSKLSQEAYGGLRVLLIFVRVILSSLGLATQIVQPLRRLARKCFSSLPL